MRRPLGLFCAAAAVFLALRGSTAKTAVTGTLNLVQEKLTETASEDGFLSLDGTVADSSVSTDGVRLTLNHVVIYEAGFAAESAAGEDSGGRVAYAGADGEASESVNVNTGGKGSGGTYVSAGENVYDSSSQILNVLFTDRSPGKITRNSFTSTGISKINSDKSTIKNTEDNTGNNTENNAGINTGNNTENKLEGGSGSNSGKTVLTLREDVCLLVSSEDDTFLPGDRIHAEGIYSSFEPATNPGQFDSQAYYFSLNIAGAVRSAKTELMSGGKQSLSRMLYRLKKMLRESYARIMDEKDAGTASAITLGEKGLMEQEWKLVYQEGGIAHIIAISGLHITMIGMTFYRLLRYLGLPFAASAIPCAFAAGCYTLMTGGSVSAVRAFVMFLIWLGAQVCGRKYDMQTSTALAAFLILAQNSQNAQSASFVLSFAAILSLAILVPALKEVCPFEAKRRTTPRNAGKVRLALLQAARGLWMTLSGGLGVWLGALPVTLAFFYQTAPWSILVNLAVIPLMSVVMASGLISGVAGLFSLQAGVFLAAPLHYLLWLFEALCELEQKLPLAVWVAGSPGTGKILAYYLILAVSLAAAGAVRKRNRREETRREKNGIQHESKRWGKSRQTENGIQHGSSRWGKSRQTENGIQYGSNRAEKLPAVILLTACVCCVGLLAVRIPDGLTVSCLDVGQGDGALVQLPDGKACLIDGGSSSVGSLWEYRIGQAVKYYGIRTLDYIFLSHADSDHISGIEEYLKACVPGRFGNARGITLKYLVLPPTADPEDFEELRQLAVQAGVSVLRMEAGDSVGNEKAGWSLTCLAPDPAALSGDKNEDSMVLRLEFGSFRMLFTGDLEGNAEQTLAASGTDLRCSVLKVGHHGSKGASSEAFLQAVRPDIAVISCGKNNSYGHPAPEAVARLENAGAALYCTAECGAVRIRSDGTTCRVSAYRK